MNTPAPSFDAYIQDFSEPVQVVLQKLRAMIAAQLPESEECISYAIPAFKVNGKVLVYFAGWKYHVSMYPIPSGDAAFEALIAPYKKGRGTLHFALDEPLPVDVISAVVTQLIATRLN